MKEIVWEWNVLIDFVIKGTYYYSFNARGSVFVQVCQCLAHCLCGGQWSALQGSYHLSPLPTETSQHPILMLWHLLKMYEVLICSFWPLMCAKEQSIELMSQYTTQGQMKCLGHRTVTKQQWQPSVSIDLQFDIVFLVWMRALSPLLIKSQEFCLYNLYLPPVPQNRTSYFHSPYQWPWMMTKYKEFFSKYMLSFWNMKFWGWRDDLDVKRAYFPCRAPSQWFTNNHDPSSGGSNALSWPLLQWVLHWQNIHTYIFV